MIRLAALSLWCSALTLGSASIALNGAVPGSDANGKSSANLEQLDTELLAAPVIANGNLTGYTLARVSLVFDAAERAKVTLPMDLIVYDAYNVFLSGNADFAFPRVKSFDYDAFTTGFRTQINAALGANVVRHVLVGQIDHFASADVRARSAARRALLRGEDDEAASR